MSLLDKICTIRYQLPEQSPVNLLLEEFRVKALIVDVSARVILTHVFTNTLETPTGRAKYIVTVPANSAVCAFEMRAADGRIVVGIAKEKTQAKEDFERAHREGKFAGLVEWVSNDTFSISVGVIPARQSVTTRLVYVLDLGVDETFDEVRFQVPIWLGKRYGPTPSGLVDASRPSTNTRIRIKADIQTSGRIREITSPTHLNEILLSPITTGIHTSHHRASMTFRSRIFLQSDFVLVIRADGLDEPRCFAEIERAPGKNGLDTIALQLTIVPKFQFPSIPSQEYIFLVDRSGSMGNDGRIQTAKRILAILLHVIPSSGSYFNICSFGSERDNLWIESAKYEQATLQYAIQHVDRMEANYGGTELEGALRDTLSNRRPMPTSIFLLTDGGISDHSGCSDAVAHAVISAGSIAPVRVFTLGIGATASSDTCEAIARAGRGMCLMAVTTESIIGKTAKLFRAGRSTSVENVMVDWGVSEANDTRSPTVNFSRDHSSKYALLPPMKALQQAPDIIRGIFPGARFSIFTIISQKNIAKPKAVTLRGQFNHGGGAFEVEIPITRIRLTAATEGAPLIHTLAAKRLITEYEEGRAQLPMAVGTATVQEVRKAIVVRLGEQFQLVSRHTSFVAVEEGNTAMQRRGVSLRNARGSQRSDTSEFRSAQGSGSSILEYLQAGLQTMSNLLLGVATSDGIHSRLERHRNFPGSWTGPLSSAVPSEILDSQEDIDDSASVMTFSTLSSLDSASEWSEWTPPPTPRPSEVVDLPIPRSQSPPLQQLINAPESLLKHHQPLEVSQGPEITASVPEVVDRLIRLQNFDGSFDAKDELSRLVGMDVSRVAEDYGFDHSVWASAVSMAFLRKRLIYQTDLYQTLFEKVTEYVKDKNVDFSIMMQRASDLVP